MGVGGKKIMERVYIRVVFCYCTVSGEAAVVISSMPPIHLLADKRDWQYETARTKKRRMRPCLCDGNKNGITRQTGE